MDNVCEIESFLPTVKYLEIYQIETAVSNPRVCFIRPLNRGFKKGPFENFIIDPIF